MKLEKDFNGWIAVVLTLSALCMFLISLLLIERAANDCGNGVEHEKARIEKREATRVHFQENFEGMEDRSSTVLAKEEED